MGFKDDVVEVLLARVEGIEGGCKGGEKGRREGGRKRELELFFPLPCLAALLCVRNLMTHGIRRLVLK